MPEPELRSWFANTLQEMARESGTDAYCGNWNACSDGLEIVRSPGPVLTPETARALLERRAAKNAAVLAVRVGNFEKAFPATAADKGLVKRLQDLKRAAEHFDWNILDRGQKAKSKTKKCGHCESSINVRKMHKPTSPDFGRQAERSCDVSDVVMSRGKVMLTHLRTLTACPVCDRELLKTDTDVKNQAALAKRIAETSAKVAAARTAFDAKQIGKTQPFWLLLGECGC